jgi:hypothetical protein
MSIRYLEQPPEDSVQHDRVRESVVVVYMAGAAKHLSTKDPKLSAIISRLLDVLYTPSEKVQKAVSQCLVPLMPHIKDTPEAEKFIKLMLERLKKASEYGDRRGAAYGLAGMVKGLGMSSLKQYNIISSLQTLIDDKKHAGARQVRRDCF